MKCVVQFKMATPITMQDIANAAGVGKATVSLALRDDPRLREETRRRIQKIALEMGYRANAVVANLMAQLRASKTPKFQATLGLINASGENKAVKGLYADKVWDQERFLASIDASRNQLSLLKSPARRISPGEYRVYLAPPAIAEIIGMFSWGAVSYNTWKKGGCALRRLIEGEACFSEKFSLKENFKLGLTPQFNSLGELPPVEVPIIEKGLLKNLLVSSRSAKEYDLTSSNAADPGGWLWEHLRSAEVTAGNLDEADILKSLDTGLYVSNLHYLNWSDVQNARITGMTRYACFWVENGEPVEPIRDLRFDESLYRIFGTELESLTRETHSIRATDTYHRRALGGRKIPGGLLRAFRFTL